MTRTRLRQDGRRSRAVSDVIAFTIVFSIIITSVGVVSAVGFTTLSDIKVDEQTVNAQRAIQSLGENLGEIQRGHAPGRAGEIAVGGNANAPSPTGLEVSGSAASVDSSALYIAEDARITVDAPGFTTTQTVGSLRYFLGEKNRSIGIESGAVFSRFRDSAVMNDPPRFVCGDTDGDSNPDYAIVSVVVLKQGDGSSAVSGGNVQIEAREVSSQLLYANASSGQDVTITIENSNFADAWIDGLTDENWDASVGPANAVGCENVEKVYVRKTVVEISLE